MMNVLSKDSDQRLRYDEFMYLHVSIVLIKSESGEKKKHVMLYYIMSEQL